MSSSTHLLYIMLFYLRTWYVPASHYSPIRHKFKGHERHVCMYPVATCHKEVVGSIHIPNLWSASIDLRKLSCNKLSCACNTMMSDFFFAMENTIIGKKGSDIIGPIMHELDWVKMNNGREDCCQFQLTSTIRWTSFLDLRLS